MQTPNSRALPKDAVLEFKELLVSKGGDVPDDKNLEVLANEFLLFMKIILKGGVKNEKQ